MIAGPGLLATPVAHAGLFGFDFDIFGGDDNKSSMHHPRPGSGMSNQSSARSAAGVAAAEAPKAKVGSQPESLGAAKSAESVGTRSLANVPENVAVAESAVGSGTGVSGGGGGGVPSATTTGRPGNLPRVSTAPSARTVVIRATPRTAGSPGSAGGPAALPALPGPPAAVPLAAQPPVSPEPEGVPASEAPPTPSYSAPQAKSPMGVSDSGTVRTPHAFRAGYPEYLRTASTTELIVEAMPGLAGIAGFTVIGAFVGYRQAKAVQRALLAPVPTSILL